MARPKKSKDILLSTFSMELEKISDLSFRKIHKLYEKYLKNAIRENNSFHKAKLIKKKSK
jgi:hypothetical protein